MKKLFVRSGIALISVILALSFTACPTDSGSSLSDSAALSSLLAVVNDQEVAGELGLAISSAEWGEYTGKDYMDWDCIGQLDFSGIPSAAVTFKATASNSAVVTYAVVKDNELPAESDFKALSEGVSSLETNDSVYFRVVSESKKVTNYYCLEVQGMGDAISNNTGINSVIIGYGTAVNLTPSNGNSSINNVTLGTYIMPSANMSGVVTLQLTRNNAYQTISWAKTSADVPADSDFTEFAQPASGDIISAVISSNGLADGDKVYIKVIAADGETILYYGFTINAGNIAELASLSLAGETVNNFGVPGAAWDDTGITVAPFDYQEDPPPAFFALVAEAEDGGTLAYAVTTGNNVPSFTVLSGTPNLPLENGSFLYIKVTSVNGNDTVIYKIKIYLKAVQTVLYGQPVITKGVSGGAPILDALWITQDWMFDISRINMNEMIPGYKFLNTVDGSYDNKGYGHTEGKAKAFWDDYGMYVYAEMTFHDYYESAGAAAAARTTVLTPPVATVADNNAHLYDSLEIFTNERVQAFTSGGYGIQYRIAPSPTGETITGTNSRVSGNPPSTSAGAAVNAITILRNSGKYYTWIRKDGGKEVGYSVIAYIPWMFAADTNASGVFKSDGTVNTLGNNDGPTVGAEFQLNAVTAGGVRDAILTWNGVNGQSYNQVRNYGKLKMVTGDLIARGITRGAKDPPLLNVSFNTNGGTPASITPISVPEGHAAGNKFPANPARSGHRFNGWYDETVTPNVKYSSTMPVTKNLNLIAHWTVGEGTIVFSLEDWLMNPPSTFATSSSPRPLAITSSSFNGVTIISDGIRLPARTTDYHGLNLYHNNSTASASNGGGSGLNLDTASKIYEIVVAGYIVGTPPAGAEVQIKDDQGTTTLNLIRPVTTANEVFEITGELPADLTWTYHIRIRSNAAGMSMPFVVTKIEVVEIGPRP
jgi:uncharacterized repeat protein (TIGR02543 family)